LLRDREHCMSLNQLAKAHSISKASVCRVLKEEKEIVSKGLAQSALLHAAESATCIPA
jgi:hypothetical protein